MQTANILANKDTVDKGKAEMWGGGDEGIPGEQTGGWAALGYKRRSWIQTSTQ